MLKRIVLAGLVVLGAMTLLVVGTFVVAGKHVTMSVSKVTP